MPIAQKIKHQFFWRGTVLCTQLLINLLLARMLGPTESGLFFLLINNLALVILLCGFSLEGAVIYYGAGDRIKKNELASALFYWIILAGSSIMVYILLAAPSSYSDLHPLWPGCYIISFLLINGFTGMYQADGDFKKYNQVILLFNLLYISFLVIIFWMQREYEGSMRSTIESRWIPFILRGYFIAVMAQAILISGKYWIGIDAPRWQRPGLNVYKKLFRYGGLALLSNLLFFLITRVDYWLVNHYCTRQDLGIYIQVSKATQMLVLPGVFISTILLPQAARDHRFLQQPVFKKLFLPFMIGNATLLGFIVLAGPILIEFLWGSAYEAIYQPLVLALPGVFFLGLSYFFSPVVAGMGKVHLNILTSLVTLLVVFFSDLLLIPKWGIPGAAIGSSLGFMVMLVIYIIIAKKLGFRFNVPGSAVH